MMDFKKYSELKVNEEFTKEKINTWLTKLKITTNREAYETRVASKILRKIIRYNSGLSQDKPTEQDIIFLKKHSADLVKLLGIIATIPTPIPYLGIAIMLNNFGIKILPSKDGLDIPDEFKKKK
jgi:hypothetical protein